MTLWEKNISLSLNPFRQAVSASPRLPTVKEMEAYLKQVECAIGVMDKVVGDGEFKGDFEKFASSINRTLKVDIKECYAGNRDDLQG